MDGRGVVASDERPVRVEDHSAPHATGRRLL